MIAPFAALLARAGELGKYQPSYSQYEYEKIVYMCRRLDITPNELFGFDEECFSKDKKSAGSDRMTNFLSLPKKQEGRCRLQGGRQREEDAHIEQEQCEIDGHAKQCALSRALGAERADVFLNEI